MIQRNEYLGRLAKLREKPPTKIISGIRGCGKTTLLALYIDWLKRTGVADDQIVYISLDDPESGQLLNYQGLYSHVKKQLCKDRFTYVFIDEIQNCTDYEKAVEGILLKKQTDMYLAVSNAHVLCGASYTEIRMLPLSFAEHLVFSRAKIPGRAEELKAFSAPVMKAETTPPQAYPIRSDRRPPRQKARMEKFLQREAFNNYLSFGGFPFASALGGDAGLTKQCVEGIYNTVLVKDVARQAGVHDIPLLEHIAQLMGGHIGIPLSSKKLCTAIKGSTTAGQVLRPASRTVAISLRPSIHAKWKKISTNTVDAYMQALTAAFVFYHAERFDIKSGNPLKTLGKYYIADTGIRNLLLQSPALCPDSQSADSQSADTLGLDGQLENLVCLELLRRGFEVCVGKHGSDEISFVAFQAEVGNAKTENGGESEKPIYFQVTASVREHAALAGKVSSLERIRDNHPKFILSLDETPFRANFNGIVQKNLVDWLLETKQ